MTGVLFGSCLTLFTLHTDRGCAFFFVAGQSLMQDPFKNRLQFWF